MDLSSTYHSMFHLISKQVKASARARKIFPDLAATVIKTPSTPQPYMPQFKELEFPLHLCNFVSKQRGDNGDTPDVLLPRWLSSDPRHPVQRCFYRRERMLRIHGRMSRQPPLSPAGRIAVGEPRQLYRQDVGKSRMFAILSRWYVRFTFRELGMTASAAAALSTALR